MIAMIRPGIFLCTTYCTLYRKHHDALFVRAVMIEAVASLGRMEEKSKLITRDLREINLIKNLRPFLYAEEKLLHCFKSKLEL